MADEIELKLEMISDDADALEASALLHGAPETVEQRSVYFDTPDLALSKRGLSLRIRCTGETCIQTVKADGASAAGLYSRSEWERPVADAVPILDYSTPSGCYSEMGLILSRLCSRCMSSAAPGSSKKAARRSNWCWTEAKSLPGIASPRFARLSCSLFFPC